MQFAGNRGQAAGGNNPLDMIQGAMKAYQTFSGDRSGSGGGGGGNFFDNMSMFYTTYSQKVKVTITIFRSFQTQLIKMLKKCMLSTNNLIKMAMVK